MNAANNASGYAEAATYLRTALLLGLITPEDAIAWADAVILRDAAPPAVVYTLALTPPELSSVREALRPLAFPAETAPVIEAVLGLAARDLLGWRRNPDDTLRVLSQLRRFVRLDAGLDEEIKNLDAQHMLAVAGASSDQREAIRTRVWELVARYAAVRPLLRTHGDHPDKSSRTSAPSLASDATRQDPDDNVDDGNNENDDGN